MADNEFMGEAEGQGRLRLEGQEAPVTYRLKGEQAGDGRYRIAVSVSAPRDWLIDNGFDRAVDLVRSNDDSLQLAYDGALDVSDNIAVTLEAERDFTGSPADLVNAYPEFATVLAPAAS